MASRAEMMKKIMTVLDQELHDFFSMVEKKHDIPDGSLWKEWDGSKPVVASNPSETVIPTDPQVKDQKKSNYQIFFSIQRSLLMKENPNMSFGEVSKKISSMWKEIPPEEKSKYVREEGSVYDHMSIKQLKKLCKDKNLTVKSSKKEDLVKALNDSTRPSIIHKEIPAEMIFSTTTSKPILHTSSGRTKLEIADEEEDIFFDEELSTEERADDDGLDDDDDDMDDLDDADIFDDD